MHIQLSHKMKCPLKIYFSNNNRTILKDVFADTLSEKQIRRFISKMEDTGIIQKEGAGKYTRYIKTPDFPSFV